MHILHKPMIPSRKVSFENHFRYTGTRMFVTSETEFQREPGLELRHPRSVHRPVASKILMNEIGSETKKGLKESRLDKE